MSKQKNFVFHGDTYEQQSNGSNKKILTTDNITAGDNINVNKSNDGKSIEIESAMPFFVQDGMLMVTYEVDDEEVQE